jgi:hypothetical protein
MWFIKLAQKYEPKLPVPQPVDMADLTKTLEPS